jgi:prolyl oligopeptidase
MRTLCNLPAYPVLVACACGGAATTPAERTTPRPEIPGAPNNIDMEPETITGSPPYPPAKRMDVVDQLHSEPVPDPYRWLEDPTNPATRTWLEANDALTRSKLDALPMRDALAARLGELLYLDAVSAPIKRGNRYFYTRRHHDKEKAVLYWREGSAGGETVLIDPNTLAEDGTTSLGDWFPSHDGTYLAYKLNPKNADEATMYVRAVASGADSEVDVIEGVKYTAAAWTPGNKGFYYTRLPTDPTIPVAERPGHAEIRYHPLGADPADDPLVFPATGSPQTFLSASVSRDGRYLVVTVLHGWNSSDVFFKDLRARRKPGKQASGATPPSADAAAAADTAALSSKLAATARELGFEVLTSATGFKYQVEVWKDRFYVLTDEGAPKFRVFAVDPRRPRRAAWQEIVAEDSATIASLAVVGQHLALTYLRDAASEIGLYSLRGKPVRSVALPDIGTAALTGNPDDDTAYFSFTSFTQPTQIYQTSAKKAGTRLWEPVPVPAAKVEVQVKQIWYASKDGTKIPMFLIHRAGLELNSNNPTILTGYGGFNVSLLPRFREPLVVWLEHGGMYAIPNLRGGGEFGEAWHRAGMLANKQNVFDDFIAAAETLIRDGYTRPDKLAIWGGSNGGLLVGAAMTQRPELFKAVICSVPLLDMVRYHLFGSGQTWVPEYGSADDPEQFRILHAYSPYHRIREGVGYPSLLMATADSDDRVDPMHARKFTAAIQWAAKGNRPYWLVVERNAGHGGADMIKQTINRYVDQLSFLLWQLGVPN